MAATVHAEIEALRAELGLAPAVEADPHGAELERTSSGSLIATAHALIRESKDGLAGLIDERIKESVSHTYKEVSAWSPRAGQAYAALQEQEAEFDAEGDAFVESLKEPEIAPELSRDAEMKAAYAEWEQQNAEFQCDGDNFAQSDSPRRRAATGYNVALGGHSNDRPANGTYAQANHQEPASSRVLLPDCSEAEKLASLQKEIAQLRASLGLLAD